MFELRFTDKNLALTAMSILKSLKQITYCAILLVNPMGGSCPIWMALRSPPLSDKVVHGQTPEE